MAQAWQLGRVAYKPMLQAGSPYARYGSAASINILCRRLRRQEFWVTTDEKIVRGIATLHAARQTFPPQIAAWLSLLVHVNPL